MDTVCSETVKKEVLSSLGLTLTQLERIWNEIGIDVVLRQDRLDTVVKHVQHLLNEMVSDEESLKTQMVEQVNQYAEDVRKLCQELSMEPFEPDYSTTLLLREKDMRNKVTVLGKEKSARLKALRKFKEEDQQLCDALCVTPYYIPNTGVPTLEELDAIEKHVSSMTEEKAKRFQEYTNSKQELLTLFSEFEYNAETSFEQEVVCEDDSLFLLSTSNLKLLNDLVNEWKGKKENLHKTIDDIWSRIYSLWDRLDVPEEERTEFKTTRQGYKPKFLPQLNEELKRLEKLKLENVQKFIEGMRREIISWWEKCFYSKEQRDNFSEFYDENYTEELLEVHERELAQLKDYYDLHQDMFLKVEKREKLFLDMVEFERKANDPNRYKNRGGNLLKEEKARKKVLQDLPKVEHEVKEAIECWEKENHRQFKVEGVAYVTYIENQWNEYERKKLQEKERKIKAKDKLMKEELMYGSKPTTPVKRRFLVTTPSKLTPASKARKLNETKTPSRVCQNSVFASPHGQVPRSSCKANTSRRRSRGLAGRKILTSRNTNAKANDTLFSHTTVSGCGPSSLSLASTGSYQDFAVGLNPTSRPFCRSSILPSPRK